MHLIEQPNGIQEIKMGDYFQAGDHLKSNYEGLKNK